MPHDLEHKAWYRLLKVLYLFCYLAAISLVVVRAVPHFPRRYLDENESRYACDDGRSRLAHNLFFFDELGIDDELRQKYEEEGAAGVFEYFVCLECAEDGEDECNSPDSPKNYTIVAVYGQHGSWGRFALTLGLGIFCVWVVFEVIKRTSLYVIVGKPFFGHG
jgi:hypothetical protein